MLHKFVEPGDWFAPKRYGYGSGLPIAWQGWVLLIAYILAMIGIALSLPALEPYEPVAISGMLVLTGLFLLVVKRRTRGGWRWRWERDGD